MDQTECQSGTQKNKTAQKYLTKNLNKKLYVRPDAQIFFDDLPMKWANSKIKFGVNIFVCDKVQSCVVQLLLICISLYWYVMQEAAIFVVINDKQFFLGFWPGWDTCDLFFKYNYIKIEKSYGLWFIIIWFWYLHSFGSRRIFL